MFHTRSWTGRRLGTDAAPGLLRWSTSPDLLNHIHSRRPDPYERGLGTTEPLGKSRCRLLLVLDGGECQRQYAGKPDCSLVTIAQVGKFDADDGSKAYWTVAGEERGAVIAQKMRSGMMRLVTLSPSRAARENTSLAVISRPSTHAHALVIRIENR